MSSIPVRQPTRRRQLAQHCLSRDSTELTSSSWCRADSSRCLSDPPLVRGVELDGQHVQGVPGGDADAAEQAEQSDHGRLAVTKGQEEAADAGDDAGAGWGREADTDS